MKNFLAGLGSGILLCVLLYVGFGNFGILQNPFRDASRIEISEPEVQNLKIVEIPFEVRDTVTVRDTVEIVAPRPFLETPRLLSSDPFQLVTPSFGPQKVQTTVWNADLQRRSRIEMKIPPRKGLVVGAGVSNRAVVGHLGFQMGRWTVLGSVGKDVVGGSLLVRF